MKKNSKNNKKSIFDDKRITFFVSLALALVSWIVVAGFIDPGQTVTISNVKIDYQKKEDDYLKKDLQIVSDQKDYTYADVTISGDGSLISGFTNTDVSVYPDYSAVNGPGEHIIPLKVDKVASGNYTIGDYSLKNGEHSLRRNPTTTITVTFEQIESKTFPVTAHADTITAAQGYFRDTPVPSVTEVTVRGPASEVAKVNEVAAIIEEDEERSESKIYTVPLQLLDDNGAVIESEQLAISPVEVVEVNIPILESRTIGLTANFIGMQQNFDKEWFASVISLSTDAMQVIGSSSAFENLSDPYPIAEFDISELDIGWESEPITIVLPEGIRSQDQLRRVVVSFDSSELIEKTFDVSNITVINSPRNATIEPVNETIRNVTLIGPPEQINALLPENITIEIDAFSVTATRGTQQTIPARVLIPSANRVFAVGSYPVVCDVVVNG